MLEAGKMGMLGRRVSKRWEERSEAADQEGIFDFVASNLKTRELSTLCVRM